MTHTVYYYTVSSARLRPKSAGHYSLTPCAVCARIHAPCIMCPQRVEDSMGTLQSLFLLFHLCEVAVAKTISSHLLVSSRPPSTLSKLTHTIHAIPYPHLLTDWGHSDVVLTVQGGKIALSSPSLDETRSLAPFMPCSDGNMKVGQCVNARGRLLPGHNGLSLLLLLLLLLLGCTGRHKRVVPEGGRGRERGRAAPFHL